MDLFALNSSQWGWIALWIILGVLIGVAVGFTKGRVLHGTLIGAVLGPLAFFALRLLPSHLVECPECSKEVHRTARRCRHCGADLDKARKLTERQRSKHQSMR